MKLERKSTFCFLMFSYIIVNYFIFYSNCLEMAEGTLMDHREDQIGDGYCNINNVLIL